MSDVQEIKGTESTPLGGAEQGAEQQTLGPAGAGEPTGSQETFFGYTFPDGTQKSWNTKEELEKAKDFIYYRSIELFNCI